MKIAVATEHGQVYGHFGKCPLFTFFTVEAGKVIHQEEIDATGSGHSAMAGFLKANGADTVICGGIGQGARDMLKGAGISLVSGASGDIGKAVADFLAGTLRDDPLNNCSHHEHTCTGHTCGEHAPTAHLR